MEAFDRFLNRALVVIALSALTYLIFKYKPYKILFPNSPAVVAEEAVQEETEDQELTIPEEFEGFESDENSDPAVIVCLQFAKGDILLFPDEDHQVGIRHPLDKGIVCFLLNGTDVTGFDLVEPLSDNSPLLGPNEIWEWEWWQYLPDEIWF